MAANTDYFRKKKSNFSTTLSSGISDSIATIPLSSASGLPTDTAITLTIDRVDANGVSTPSLVERVTGVISGSNLTTSLRGEDGTSAQSHASAAVVEDIWDADTWNETITGILVGHTQAGLHNFTVVYDSSANETLKLSGVASAVNEITIKNAITTTFPKIQATGEADTGINFENSEDEEGLILDFIASAINEITISNAATGNAPQIAATGGGTNINLKLKGKATGGVETYLGAESTADVTATGNKVSLTAGENLAFGEACYIKAADGKAWKADASAIATSSAIVIALATISADAAGDFLLMGIARNDAWAWTVGGLVYLSETAGALTQTAPTTTDSVTQILGVATHADRLFFNPQLVQVEHT